VSVLELKQEITRLNRRDREEVYAYLVRCRHETAVWRRTTARLIRSMRKGKGVTAEELEARLGIH
jgi:hypothetical protein